jgi:predicted PurR-regulated permease PerM
MSHLSANFVAGQTTRWVLTAVIIVVLLLVFWVIAPVLLLTLTSVMLVVLFTTPIRFLTRRGVNKSLATMLSLALIVGFLVITVIVILPVLISQFATLAVLVQQGIEEILQSWNNLDAGQTKYFLGWGFANISPSQDPLAAILRFIRDSLQLNADFINQVASQVFGALSQISVSVLPLVSGVAGTLLNFLIVIFLSLYFLADPRGHEDGLIKLLPISYRPRAREIVDRLDLTLRGWLESTLLAMVFVGLVTWIVLSILGLREAAALGMIAGVLSFVPNFGTLIALIPAVAVGILQQPQNVGWIIVVTYAISLIQSQIISPLLIAGRINLPPVLVLLGQIIAGTFFGFLGILLAVPLAAILMVLVQEVYIKDILGDRSIGARTQEPEGQRILIDDGLMSDGV